MNNCHWGRSLPAFIFATIFLLSSAHANAQDADAQQLARLKKGVVIVTTFDNHGTALMQGSGFFVDSGQVATNFHVIRNASQIRIETFDGTISKVRIVLATDEKNDLALMSVDAMAPHQTILPMKIGAPAEGESVTVISNPQGSNWKVTRGATGLLWELHGMGERLQITASIAPGSSGGPVINSRGEVIAVASMYFNSVSNLSFAVPVARLQALHARSHVQARVIEAGR